MMWKELEMRQLCSPAYSNPEQMSGKWAHESKCPIPRKINEDFY